MNIFYQIVYDPMLFQNMYPIPMHYDEPGYFTVMRVSVPDVMPPSIPILHHT